MEWIIVLIIGLVVLGGIAIWAVKLYNSLVSLRNVVEEGESQIATQLQRRYDLIPNLVETVKGYATHENETFSKVTEARNLAGRAIRSKDPADVQAAENAMSDAMVNVNAVAEAYPDLKANQNFLELQRELTHTENKVGASRTYFNSVVYDYNTKVETFPSNVVANLFNFDRKNSFEVESEEARKAPDVQF